MPYAGFTDDFNKWMAHKDGSALAALVDLLVKSSRGAIDQVEASARLCPELAQMAGRAVAELSSDSADPGRQATAAAHPTDRPRPHVGTDRSRVPLGASRLDDNCAGQHLTSRLASIGQASSSENLGFGSDSCASQYRHGRVRCDVRAVWRTSSRWMETHLRRATS